MVTSSASCISELDIDAFRGYTTWHLDLKDTVLKGEMLDRCIVLVNSLWLLGHSIDSDLVDNLSVRDLILGIPGAIGAHTIAIDVSPDISLLVSIGIVHAFTVVKVEMACGLLCAIQVYFQADLAEEAVSEGSAVLVE